MSEILGRLGYSVLTRDASLSELEREGEVIEGSELRRPTKREPALCIITASQLDLHVPLPLTRTQGQARYRVVVYV
jgi:hypothetical protein